MTGSTRGAGDRSEGMHHEQERHVWSPVQPSPSATGCRSDSMKGDCANLRGMKKALPWILLAFGAVVYAMQLCGPTWDSVKRARHARDFASYYYAVQATSQGLDPYHSRTLTRLARRDGTRTGVVHPYFYPPPFLLAVAWTKSLSLETAYRTWFWLEPLWLLAVLLAIWRWLPGSATVCGIGVLLASFQPVLGNHTIGQANLPVLAATLWGLYHTERARSVLGGALVGIACMMKMSPALLVAWWMLRRKWSAVASACVTALLLSLLALPVADLETQLRFFRDVLPGFASGDYNGLMGVVGGIGNQSIAGVWAQALPWSADGISWARVATSLTNLGLLGAVAGRLRNQQSDLLGAACGAGAVMCLMLLLPLYTYMHHLVQLIPPLIATLIAITRGRLGRAGWVALGLAYLPMMIPWSIALEIIRGSDGLAVWILQESRTFSVLALCATCAIAATREDHHARASGTHVLEGAA